MDLGTIIKGFSKSYAETTQPQLKLIDAFLVYTFLTGVIQFVYCALVGTFPFNSFLSGFISCVGSFILTVNPSNNFGISWERAYADFVLCNVILHLVIMNFLG